MELAKAHLSRYLEEVERGATVVICRGGVPIAEIRPILRARSEKRPIGLEKGLFTVEESFFEPLPGDLQRGFEGADG